mmetsp:Transcript_5712/g.11697  ORF Transcript_5712/g.11697 Transcript_5712/m.11697 type:complete len:99 (+) Transcript_5712:500-796(+)
MNGRTAEVFQEGPEPDQERPGKDHALRHAARSLARAAHPCKQVVIALAGWLVSPPFLRLLKTAFDRRCTRKQESWFAKNWPSPIIPLPPFPSCLRSRF